MANLPVLSDARVLVIDDEPDLRTLYELTLLREGYRVETAGSVQEAQEHLTQQRFDAIITDMRLPDGMGTDILARLRTDQRNERCIVITAYGSAENAVESLKAGAFDYLSKPVDLKQFRAVVANALQNGHVASGVKPPPWGTWRACPHPTKHRAVLVKPPWPDWSEPRLPWDRSRNAS